MKTILFTVFALILVQDAIGQESNTPRTEFAIGLSAKELEIKPGETREVQINLYRSKGYTKSKAKLGLSSTLPEGIKLTYEPSEGVISSSTVKIEASEDVKPGNYLLMLNCTIQHKSKGIMLKVIVKESSSEAVSKADHIN